MTDKIDIKCSSLQQITKDIKMQFLQALQNSKLVKKFIENRELFEEIKELYKKVHFKIIPSEDYRAYADLHQMIFAVPIRKGLDNAYNKDTNTITLPLLQNDGTEIKKVFKINDEIKKAENEIKQHGGKYKKKTGGVDSAKAFCHVVNVLICLLFVVIIGWSIFAIILICITNSNLDGGFIFCGFCSTSNRILYDCSKEGTSSKASAVKYEVDEEFTPQRSYVHASQQSQSAHPNLKYPSVQPSQYPSEPSTKYPSVPPIKSAYMRGGKHMVHTGPRGGKYVVVNGKKVYV
jgi:predicted transcriptional regulator with HTH domain